MTMSLRYVIGLILACGGTAAMTALVMHIRHNRRSFKRIDVWRGLRNRTVDDRRNDDTVILSEFDVTIARAMTPTARRAYQLLCRRPPR